MKIICKLRKKHLWGDTMYIPPDVCQYKMRVCRLCGRVEYYDDPKKGWTDEYPCDIILVPCVNILHKVYDIKFLKKEILVDDRELYYAKNRYLDFLKDTIAHELAKELAKDVKFDIERSYSNFTSKLVGTLVYAKEVKHDK